MNSYYEHNHICIETNFEEIRIIDENQNIELEYQYVADNLIRKREKPFADQEYENVLIWLYDNFHSQKAINYLKIRFNIDYKFNDTEKILAYPERFSKVKN